MKLLGPLTKLIETEANRRAKSSNGSGFFTSFASAFTGKGATHVEKIPS